MKVLISDMMAPEYPKFLWIKEAFESLGHEVMRASNPVAFEDQEPHADLVLFSQRPSIDWSDASELADMGRKHCPWVVWIFDFLDDVLPLKGQIAWSILDAAFSKTHEHAPHEVRDSFYLDQACPPWPYPDEADLATRREYDVLLPGHHTPGRAELAALCVRKRLKTAIAGPCDGPLGWTVDNARVGLPGGLAADYLGDHRTDEAMQALFRRADAVTGDNYGTRREIQLRGEKRDRKGRLLRAGRSAVHTHRPRGYWSDRCWLAMAAGSVYVGPYVSGMGRFLTDRNLDFPNTLGLIKDRKWLAAQRQNQRTIADANRYSHRVRQMVKLLVDHCILDPKFAEHPADQNAEVPADSEPQLALTGDAGEEVSP